jgi:nucleotide-binding universal stress UspA family protein
MNVLIAVDLGSATSAVIAGAKSVFSPASGKCWVLHVVEPDPEFVGYEPGPQPVRDALARRYREQHEAVQRVGNEMRADGYECTALLVQGAFAETILKEAQDISAGVIVVGSRGKPLAKRLFVGSTSRSVLKGARVPVLVVPA